MLKDNGPAIDLGLEVALALNPGKSLTQCEIAAYCEAAREILGIQSRPLTFQDFGYLENRAIKKLRKRIGCKTFLQWTHKLA